MKNLPSFWTRIHALFAALAILLTSEPAFSALYPFQKAFSCPLILQQFKLYQDHLRAMEGHYEQTQATRAHLQKIRGLALGGTTGLVAAQNFLASASSKTLSPLSKARIAGRITRFERLLDQPAHLSQGQYTAAVTLQGRDWIVDYLQNLAKKIEVEMQTLAQTGVRPKPNMNYAAAGLVAATVGAAFFSQHLAQVLDGDLYQLKRVFLSGLLTALGNSLYTGEMRKTDQLLEDFLEKVVRSLQRPTSQGEVITVSQTYKILPSTWRSSIHNTQGAFNKDANFIKDQSAMYYGQPFNAETITRLTSLVSPEEKPLYVSIDLIFENSVITADETSMSIIVNSSEHPPKSPPNLKY